MTSAPRGATTDPLDRQLKELPTVRASTRFSERVLERLNEPKVSWALSPVRMAWAGVGACALLVAVLTIFSSHPADRGDSLSAEAVALRRQHALLTEELDRLRARSNEAAPVLYLGSDAEVDYVLDLSPFLLPQTGTVLPASRTNPSSTF